MSVELNHTIVRAHDKQETARHLVEILGLPEPTTFGPFVVVQVANGVLHVRGHVDTTSGAIDAANIVWAAGVGANSLTKNLGVEVDRGGRIKVLPDLSVPGHP